MLLICSSSHQVVLRLQIRPGTFKSTSLIALTVMSRASTNNIPGSRIRNGCNSRTGPSGDIHVAMGWVSREKSNTSRQGGSPSELMAAYSMIIQQVSIKMK